MTETFAQLLTVGGKANSLGRSAEVVQEVLGDRSRLEELYGCLFDQDPWVRMGATDSLEKVCRIHPEWIKPYADRLLQEVSKSSQPSLQWHLAQIFAEIELTSQQKERAAAWLAKRLGDEAVDWIVAANCMDTLAQFVADGAYPQEELISLLRIQQKHRSKAVVKRAEKLLDKLSG